MSKEKGGGVGVGLRGPIDADTRREVGWEVCAVTFPVSEGGNLGQ